MFELLLTSFPVIIRYFQLRRRGEALTVWNMKSAVFLWLGMAFFLFLMIFYFHPKSYSGLLPFRTVSVVAQTSGPVTEVSVINGQRVAAGDLLFRIENSSQKAALAQAEAKLLELQAAETKAQDALLVAQSTVVEAEASLGTLQVDLDNAVTLFEKNVGAQENVRKLEASVTSAEAALAAAQAQVDLAKSDLEETIPAQRAVADAAVESAQVALHRTEVRSFTDGTVTQLSLNVGSPGVAAYPEPGDGHHPRPARGFPAAPDGGVLAGGARHAL